eukprot:TRINITY_DN12126_c0_g2_i1.p2 TRINITY_DN12126_c0_g2~~TRINITY_DN12126_c0_g2_i1.p2  ORF type:complete len:107 (+),score=19.67 TRINITY_DN12126_c0_g2_i1:2-322(+)
MGFLNLSVLVFFSLLSYQRLLSLRPLLGSTFPVGSFLFFFFFFKQKTAYEMLRSLVGSEMCIRDRYGRVLCGLCVVDYEVRVVLVVKEPTSHHQGGSSINTSVPKV